MSIQKIPYNYDIIKEILDFSYASNPNKSLNAYLVWIKNMFPSSLKMDKDQEKFKQFVEGEKVVIMDEHPEGSNGCWTIITNYGRIYNMWHKHHTVYKHYDYWMNPEKIIELREKCSPIGRGKFLFSDICKFVSESKPDLIKENNELKEKYNELEIKLKSQDKMIELIRSNLRNILSLL